MAETIAECLCGNSCNQAVMARSDTMQAQTGRMLRKHEHAIKMESDELDELRNITVNFADQWHGSTSQEKTQKSQGM